MPVVYVTTLWWFPSMFWAILREKSKLHAMKLTLVRLQYNWLPIPVLRCDVTAALSMVACWRIKRPFHIQKVTRGSMRVLVDVYLADTLLSPAVGIGNIERNKSQIPNYIVAT